MPSISGVNNNIVPDHSRQEKLTGRAAKDEKKLAHEAGGDKGEKKVAHESGRSDRAEKKAAPESRQADRGENATAHESRGADRGDNKADPEVSKDTVTDQTKKMLIELNINIKVESKSRIEVQAALAETFKSTETDMSQFRVDGKPVLELSRDEARELISEDGFYGVEQTAERIIDFAVNGAGDDVERLQVAREAVLLGFQEAEDIFGGSLPEISYVTRERVLEVLDGEIRDMGGSVLNIEA